MTSGEQLCLACGLCCDGTLFDNVRLSPSDDAKKLKTLGLPISVPRAQRPVAYFSQPCTALCPDRTCRLYTDRPAQCRSFECGVFGKVAASKVELPAALKLVRQARRQAEKIRRLLRQLGDSDEDRSLSMRFLRTKQRMETGAAAPSAADTFSELSLAMHRFGLLAHKKFHTRADAP